jgi:transposase
MGQRLVRYSEAFKLKVVDELERGRFGSPFEVGEAYGIGCSTTVERWVRQYGKGHLLKKVVRVEKEGEPGELKRLKQRVRVLEEALADADAEERLSRAYFELLCQELKVDPDGFKKKHAGERCIERMDMRGEANR